MEKVKAVYVGRRQNTKHQIRHFWLFEGKEQLTGFKDKVTGAKIGDTWILTGDGNSYYFGGEHRPVHVPGDLHPDTAKFEAEDITAVGEAEQERLAKKLGQRSSEFDKALAPLRVFCLSLNHVERKYVIDKIVTELWRR